jgi:hypothetical protein
MILLPEVVIVAVSIWCIRGVEPLPKERQNAGEEQLRLSNSTSRSQPPSGQEPPEERHQLRRRQTP